MTDAIYYPNSSNCTAWKWRELVSGFYGNKTPDERGRVPANLKNIEFTAEELNTVSADDDNYVDSVRATLTEYTARAAIMIELHILEAEGDITQLAQLLRGACLLGAITCDMEQRFYLWDFTNSEWDDMNDYITGLTKDTHESVRTVDIGDVIESSIIYFLQWDYEGCWTAGGACVSPKSPILTPSGLHFIKHLKPKDPILAWRNRRLIKDTVIAQTSHSIRCGELLDVLTHKGLISVKPSHPVFTREYGVLSAEAIKHFYDLGKRFAPHLLYLQGNRLIPLEIVGIRENRTERWFDITTESGNYFIGNILVHNRAKMVI